VCHAEEVPQLRRVLTILVLVTAAAALVAGCAGEGGGGQAAGPSTAAPATTAGQAGGAGGGGDRGGYGGGYGAEPTSSRSSARADADVRIHDFAFGPTRLEAKAGQRVTWGHQDVGVTHTVTADKGEFRSGDLNEGKEFSHLFRTAGIYAYHCAIHPDMRGTVRVSG
jgi:plastocyanin